MISLLSIPIPSNGIELLAVVPIALLVLLFTKSCYNYFRCHLNSIPGPFFHAISTLPRLLSVYRGNSHWEDFELHKKYGKIVRVSPTTVSVCDLALFESIYSISSRFYKAGFYEGCRFYDEEGLLPDPLVLADKEVHTRMKRNAANAYSLQALVQIEPLVDETLRRLIGHLDETYVTREDSCDLGLYMLYFAMVSIVFVVAFLHDFDHREGGYDSGLIGSDRTDHLLIGCHFHNHIRQEPRLCSKGRQQRPMSSDQFRATIYCLRKDFHK